MKAEASKLKRNEEKISISSKDTFIRVSRQYLCRTRYLSFECQPGLSSSVAHTTELTWIGPKHSLWLSNQENLNFRSLLIQWKSRKNSNCQMLNSRAAWTLMISKVCWQVNQKMFSIKRLSYILYVKKCEIQFIIQECLSICFYYSKHYLPSCTKAIIYLFVSFFSSSIYVDHMQSYLTRYGLSSIQYRIFVKLFIMLLKIHQRSALYNMHMNIWHKI